MASAKTSEALPEHVAGDGLAAAMDVMIAKLQQVSVTAARPNYVVTSFNSTTNDVENWLQQFEQYAKLQQLTSDQYADAFAFHVTGIAQTWYVTLPDSVKINWTALKEAFRTRFKISQQARWRQECGLYNLRQHPGQTVASFMADILQAAGGLQLSEAQKV